MVLGGGKERLTYEEISAQYQDAFSRIKKLYGFSQGESDIERVIEFVDGYRIWADYRGRDWMAVRVTSGEDKILSFTLRDSGLESITFHSPVLALGDHEVQLDKVGMGYKAERLFAVGYEFAESDNLAILGIELIDWIESSDKDRRPRPLDLSIKLRHFPQER